MTDDELMTAFQSGDDDAFTTLYNRHYGAIARWARLRGVGHHAAEDFAQDVFTTISVRRHRYAAKGRFSQWLVTVARNLLIDAGRRSKSDPMSRAERGDASLYLMAREESPTRSIEVREIAALCREVMAAILPDDQLDALTWQSEGESLPDIAYATEATLPTTKSRVRLAREKVAAKFAFRSQAARQSRRQPGTAYCPRG